ncbi:MAG: hypothetical protein KDJ18_06950 [Hyphomicrobiaceae bacterium]|nr:hypothetical protein [Hyphomicrobiaceae bacterium]
MAAFRKRPWPIAILFVIASLPASFLLGVVLTIALQKLRGAPVGGGEGVQADAYAALFLGGPIGMAVASAFIGWLTLQFADRLSRPVVSAILITLLASSALALYEMSKG